MTKPGISFDEFSKIEVSVGTVQTAERVPEVTLSTGLPVEN